MSVPRSNESSNNLGRRGEQTETNKQTTTKKVLAKKPIAHKPTKKSQQKNTGKKIRRYLNYFELILLG